MLCACQAEPSRLIQSAPGAALAQERNSLTRDEAELVLEQAGTMRVKGELSAAAAHLERALANPMSPIMRMRMHADLGTILEAHGDDDAHRQALTQHEVVLEMWHTWGPEFETFDEKTNTHERRLARSLASQSAFRVAGSLRDRAEAAPLVLGAPSSLTRRLALTQRAIERYEEVIVMASSAPRAERATEWIAASHYTIGMIHERLMDESMRIGTMRPSNGLSFDHVGLSAEAKAKALARYRKALLVRESDDETALWRRLARARLCQLTSCR